MSTISSAIGSADQVLARLRSSANLSSMVAFPVVALLLLTPLPWMQQASLFALVATFFAIKRYRAHRAQRSRYQLALDEQFALTPPPAPLLEACLERDDHLWRHSLILAALRVIRKHPPSRFLALKEKRRHLHQHVHAAFAPLHRSRFSADGLFLIAPLLMSTSALAPSWWMAVPLGLLLAVAAAEAWHMTLLQRLPATLEIVEAEVSAWILHQHADTPLGNVDTKPYVHTLLYQSPAWFVNKPSQPASTPKALRDVA